MSLLGSRVFGGTQLAGHSWRDVLGGGIWAGVLSLGLSELLSGTGYQSQCYWNPVSAAPAFLSFSGRGRGIGQTHLVMYYSRKIFSMGLPLASSSTSLSK
jgi:hypothetical protein